MFLVLITLFSSMMCFHYTSVLEYHSLTGVPYIVDILPFHFVEAGVSCLVSLLAQAGIKRTFLLAMD
jgi:hypothetical protein